MVTNLLFFVLISAGSIFSAIIYGKRYEEVLPLSIFAIVILLYVFGIIHQLLLGVYLVIAMCMLLLALAAVYMIKNKCWGNAKLIVTPAFFLFALLYVIFNYADFLREVSGWDELSHWADTVKAMYQINDFGTNPEAFSIFPSYPPAMSLFQYFLQALYRMLSNGAQFSEWRLYTAYQTFGAALIMPFLTGLNWKNPKKILAWAAITLCYPVIIFANYYKAVYIDPILGYLAGFAAIYIYIYIYIYMAHRAVHKVYAPLP